MSKKGIKQAFKEGQYTPQFLQKQNLSTLRQDYTRLRDIMRKRYKRLKSKGYSTNFTKAVKQWGTIPTIKQFTGMSKGDKDYLAKELAYWLSELKSYETEETTIKYQRERREELQTALQDSGYDVDTEDIDAFGEFMDYIRQTSLDKVFYSSTYRATDTGYRAKRDERTDKEKADLMRAFDKWKKGQFDITEYEISAD